MTVLEYPPAFPTESGGISVLSVNLWNCAVDLWRGLCYDKQNISKIPEKRKNEVIPLTIEQCYDALGGSYADVCGRLPSSRLVEKFMGKFLEDDSFSSLCLQMERRCRSEAFRAAHTLKGVCANLGFTRLYESASRLTEALRPEGQTVSDEEMALLDPVRRDYEATAGAIARYLAEK